MMKKALIKFEGKTYWLDIEDLSKAEVEVLEDGKWRDVNKNEIDLFSLMETGEVIGDERGD